jgi:hypothetical protein
MKSTLLILGITLGLTGAAQAQAGAGGTEEVGSPSLEAVAARVSAEAVDAIIAKFHSRHVTETPVEAWMAVQDEEYSLWSMSLGEVSYEVSWDPMSASVIVVQDGVVRSDLVMYADQALRPAFIASLEDGGELSGFVDYDEEQGLAVLEFNVQGEGFRIVGTLDPDDGDSTFLIAATRTCVCFGAPGGGRSCSNDECDEGDSCGTATNGTNKACRWKAGTALETAVDFSVEAPSTEE